MVPDYTKTQRIQNSDFYARMDIGFLHGKKRYFIKTIKSPLGQEGITVKKVHYCGKSRSKAEKVFEKVLQQGVKPSLLTRIFPKKNFINQNQQPITSN